MALTITNHLIRGADAPHIAGFGDGAGTVIWLPGRVLTEGRAAATKTAGGPARSRLIATQRCTTKGSGPVWTPGPVSSALPDQPASCTHRGCPGAG
jgi:hypothetical protein